MSSIVVHGVSLELASGRPLFSNLHFSLSSGVTALVGPNGVGKTCLARILAGELAPTEGVVRRDGVVKLFPQRAARSSSSRMTRRSSRTAASHKRSRSDDDMQHDSRMTLPSQALTRNGSRRLDAIDMLRGLVIALMVLDHVRDFFHSQALLFNPTDPERTTLALYATRWITHLCAPTFVFLAGTSIYLQRVNGKAPGELSQFLLKRGLWLLVLELTIVGLGFNFAPVVFLQVIWAIGVGMMLLALLVRAPPAAVGVLGALIVAGHQLVGPIDGTQLGSLGLLWSALFELRFMPGIGLIAYPLIPWFGILCLGYGLGSVFTLVAERRDRMLLMLGTGCLVAFVLLRAFVPYGDPAPWRSYPSTAQTLMSFLNISKYPPSLLYVLATLGVSVLLLPALDRLKGPLATVLLAYGRTPLFTYLLHIYIAHGAALLVGVAVGVPAASFTNFILDPSPLARAQWGFPLAGVYVAWVAVLAALYPLSRWFAAVKQRRRDGWLSYL